jgi:hypothetical protein
MGNPPTTAAQPLTGLGQVALLAMLTIAVGPASAQDQGVGRRSLIGTNLSGVGSIVTQWDFADLMKGSNPWVYDGGPHAGQRTPVDALGNPVLLPGEKANTLPRLKITEPPYDRVPDYPTGSYTITWEGKGSFILTGDGDVELINATGAGTRTFTAASGGETLFLRIDSMDQADPLRNIRIWMPTYAPGQAHAGKPFHQTFVDRSATPFGNLRFMDWNRVNDATQSQWTQRTKDQANQYSIETGVPIEEQLRLVNQTHGDVWFNMPAHADDDYVTNFAQGALFGIDAAGNPYSSPQANPVTPPVAADRKIYVEYANEAWNDHFEGFDYITQQATAAGLHPSGLNQDFAKQWAVEARRDFDVWKNVFAAAGQQDRVRRVAAIQTSNRFISPMFLKELVVGGVPQFDVLAPAFYVGVNSSSYGAATTKDKIIDDLFASLQQQVDPTITTFLPGTPFQVVGPAGDWLLWRQFADQYDVELIAYEGGQSINTGTTAVPWYDDYLAAQRDPRMYDFYRAWLEAIIDTAGADGVDIFSSVAPISQYGAWGHLEYQDQPLAEAHKLRAILDFARGLGDFDLNGWYNAADIDLLRAARGLPPTGANAAFDVDGDGSITEQDVVALLRDRLRTAPGDVDLDGDVDADDLSRLKDGFGPSGSWIVGDMTGDGSVDGADFLVWQQHVTGSTARNSTVAPEPVFTLPSATAIATWMRLLWGRRSGNALRLK